MENNNCSLINQLNKKYNNYSMFLGYVGILNILATIFVVVGKSTFSSQFNYSNIIYNFNQLQEPYKTILNVTSSLAISTIFCLLAYFACGKKQSLICLIIGIILYFLDLIFTCFVTNIIKEPSSLTLSIVLHLLFLAAMVIAVIYKIKLIKLERGNKND